MFKQFLKQNFNFILFFGEGSTPHQKASKGWEFF